MVTAQDFLASLDREIGSRRTLQTLAVATLGAIVLASGPHWIRGFGLLFALEDSPHGAFLLLSTGVLAYLVAAPVIDLLTSAIAGDLIHRDTGRIAEYARRVWTTAPLPMIPGFAAVIVAISLPLIFPFGVENGSGLFALFALLLSLPAVFVVAHVIPRFRVASLEAWLSPHEPTSLRERGMVFFQNLVASGWKAPAFLVGVIAAGLWADEFAFEGRDVPLSEWLATALALPAAFFLFLSAFHVLEIILRDRSTGMLACLRTQVLSGRVTVEQACEAWERIDTLRAARLYHEGNLTALLSAVDRETIRLGETDVTRGETPAS